MMSTGVYGGNHRRKRGEKENSLGGATDRRQRQIWDTYKAIN